MGLDRCVNSETQVIQLVNVASGTFSLQLGEGGATVSGITWDAPASAVQAAIETLVGAGNVTVTEDGTSYTAVFKGALNGVDIAQLIATLDTAAASSGGTAAVHTSVPGGVSTAIGGTLDFTSANWWIPQTVYFAVDDKAASIPNSPTSSRASKSRTARSRERPPTARSATISNPNVVGDEYATLISTGDLFTTPTADLPEGLRGEQLKITGGDDEANGQVRLILGSYRTNVTVPGSVTSYTLSFGSATSGAINPADGLAGILAALNAIPVWPATSTVTGTGTGSRSTLLGTLYLTNGVHFTLGSSTGGTPTRHDGRQLDQARSAVGRRAESGTRPDVRGRSLRRRPRPEREGQGLRADAPSVVVSEDGGSSTVAECSSTALDDSGAAAPSAPDPATRTRSTSASPQRRPADPSR